MWQPRDSRGRFGSGGGGSEPDPLSEWLFRQKWWVIVLFIIALIAFMLWLYYSGYILVFIIGCFALSLILPRDKGIVEVDQETEEMISIV